jgi:FKBP-type peptidyl-prolyl cis-trans isomerase 2
MNQLFHQKAALSMTILIACLGILSQPSLAFDSPRIIDGSTVTLLYHITVPGHGGLEVKDISQFVQGQHKMLPAIERIVTGMKSGHEKRVELSPEQGFGPYDPNKKTTVPRIDLPDGTKEGDILKDRTGKQATVTQLSDSSAVMDYNHPLAGKPLSVKVKILRVDNPS